MNLKIRYFILLSITFMTLLTGCIPFPYEPIRIPESVIYLINNKKMNIDLIITLLHPKSNRPYSCETYIEYYSITPNNFIDFRIDTWLIHKKIDFNIFDENQCKNYMEEHYKDYFFTEEQVSQLLENCQPKVTYTIQPQDLLLSPDHVNVTCLFLQPDGNLEATTEYYDSSLFRREQLEGSICGQDPTAGIGIRHEPKLRR